MLSPILFWEVLYFMHRFSTSSHCACFLIGIIVFFFLPLIPWSVQNVHGADVTLAWDPNPEANLKGYKVYYGSTGGNYSFMVDAGNRTSLTISGLEAGKTYYFAATAYGPAGEESDLSDELRYDTPQADSSILSPTKAANATAIYTINASAGPNGSISPSGDITVRRGSNQTFIIRPGRGYRIGRVDIDAAYMYYVTSHTFTRINANHTIRAEFESIWSYKKKTDGIPFVPLIKDSRFSPARR
jgi:hypothetical protein